ncbi:MAG: sulfatase-like hydrolase/transferase [Planctomycetota bacterium]
MNIIELPSQPTRRSVSAAVAVWMCVSFCLAADRIASAADRPNIVFVMTDDQGYWDTGATGNPHIDTPNMDRVAAEGVQLNRYYAAPVCSPTRAGLMTGRYYLRTGLYNTRFGGDSLGLDEITLPTLLQEAGYRTGMFGKWHLGKYPDYQPQNRGFDEFFGHYHGHIERYEFPDQVYHNGVPVEARGYVTDLFTDAAIDFVEHIVRRTKQPFFCALTYNAPHSPFLLDTSHFGQSEGDELIAKYLDRGLPIREARIYGLIERVDSNLGRLLKKLSDLGIADDTLLVFTSDNGGVSRFFNAGMNGRKASVYEGGVRAPCFVRWPKRIPRGKVIEAQTSHVDWLPTFCELAGIQVPDGRPIDGLSLVKLLTDGEGDEHHRFVYHTWDRYTPNAERRWSISEQRWKLLCQLAAEDPPSRSRWRLFDLHSDPGEKANLARQHPEIVDRLRQEFVTWFDEVTEGQDYRPIRIPVGGDGVATELSPSWATWNGNHVSYQFDGYDWDTIEGWKSPGESAQWRLDVKTPGQYEVTLRYGCRPQESGGVVRIVAESDPNDERGAKRSFRHLDHTVVATATADQFQEFSVGTIDLTSGPCQLKAEVVRSNGGELMRLNSIRLSKR